MPTVALELNDAALAIAGAGGLVDAGAGHAAEVDGALCFGPAARGRLWSQPLSAQRRYWADLGEGALPRPLGPCRSSADLVQAHLAALWTGCAGAEAAVLAPMPGWSRGQLGLLLGLARAAGIPVAGLVDPAVAAVRRPFPGQALWHLQGTLDSLWLTRLEQTPVGVSLGERARIGGCGVEAIERGCAEFVARSFLVETRFDPLHDAAGEQALHDALPDWLAALGRSARIAAELRARERSLTATIHSAALRERVMQICEPLLRRLRAALSPREPAVLLVEHRLADFPGLIDLPGRFPALTAVLLEPGATARGALRLAPHPEPGAALPLVTRLAFDQEGTPLPPPVAAGDLRRPTHVLYGSRLWRIGVQPLQVGTALDEADYGIRLPVGTQAVSRRHFSLGVEDGRVVVHDQSRYGTWLNGLRIEGQAVLEAGDVLAIGQPPQLLTLVEESAHGP